ncbi:ABC transporter ATP-binding protein [Ferrovum myxofaciens]|jgi:lipoprotein-releasing system ATP-binding protein|uniref:ATP-binding cassette domain-containing protein n=2 Tax=root TaxID=1 RepID=A0A9E6MWL1_9PROT|nr:ATP-binding cassette domain-containing protein [Ferrovum myxofaciens]MBU6994511.1 ATP-binding cassette domain-containing protein [Ferrovum myxofaciens]QKE38382.1 MAG: ATP-binding cassette domain-containing protein [Ferrovum myxofaciens]QWY73562.1 MAG: ATP-binding cassette domain-containing protein [Ferrovum myxofaciens]QWY76317.1 MAG: ATP-binding cassette domain-containing protein [Ferrovum myxofaciens]
MSEMLLRCQGVTRHFTLAADEVPVLRGLDLEVQKGEQIAILGASGSGKSTLLHVLGGLDRPNEGQVSLCGQNLTGLSDRQIGRLRNRHLGFVYQFHHLLAEFSALENVMLPLSIARIDSVLACQRATEMLEAVGLGQRLHHRPGELSGGERQRAAVARALVTRPSLVLADEPTGNLDRQTAWHVFELILSLNRRQGAGLVMATHDLELADRMDRRYRLEDGVLRAL